MKKFEIINFDNYVCSVKFNIVESESIEDVLEKEFSENKIYFKKDGDNYKFFDEDCEYGVYIREIK